jgi:hypothetical protein
VSTTSSTTSSSTTPTNTSDVKGLSVGAEAGIGVGASLAGLAILGATIWFILRTRRRKRAHVDGSWQPDGNGYDINFQKSVVDGETRDGLKDKNTSNVEEPYVRHELDGSRSMSELPTH